MSPARNANTSRGRQPSIVPQTIMITGARSEVMRFSSWPSAWIVPSVQTSVVSTIDIVHALVVALANGVYRHYLGVGWFVLILYVPLVCVSQAAIYAYLRRDGLRQPASATVGAPNRSPSPRASP